MNDLHTVFVYGTLGSHPLFEERDRGDIVLGRVKAGVPPR